ncbi:MAG TPA: permease [Solirubrobacteraceae bacterium]|nr:permease [Solirubrobacteraceae bacterium]
MSAVLSTLGEGLANALLMAWQVWWALMLGFAISAIVQAWVPRQRIQAALGGSGARPVALATGLGAASSSCSYAAVAIAKSLFQKGASAASALAFQFASTNLVLELGIVIWVLLGWQFTLAELLGGLVLILVMTLLLRLFVSKRLEDSARRRAERVDAGHQHHSAGASLPLRARLTSVAAWSDVAHNFRNDLSMLWREIALGFLLAGFIGLLPNDFFNALFLHGAPAPLRVLENVLVGPLIAVLSFVCSVGNVPLAAVLWSGGIGFAGVISFLFADLIVIPIVLIYRKYYGTAYALRTSALMLVTIVIAALVIYGVFSLAGLIPSVRPTRTQVFGHVAVDYKLFTNILGLAIFIALMSLTIRRGASDPVCGMQVDRGRALRLRTGSRTLYFCSERCRESYEGARRADGLAGAAASHPGQGAS